MKKTYIAPTVKVEEAEAEDLLLVTSIRLSGDSGDEEYVKEQSADDVDGDWDFDW